MKLCIACFLSIACLSSKPRLSKYKPYYPAADSIPAKKITVTDCSDLKTAHMCHLKIKTEDSFNSKRYKKSVVKKF